MSVRSLYKWQAMRAPIVTSSVRMALETCLACPAGKDTENEQHGEPSMACDRQAQYSAL